MTDLIPFSLRVECPKCGTTAFGWQYRETASAPGMECIGDPSSPRLLLTCRNCGWRIGMRCKDAKP
jgi:DNA-directed RNA polymerase subunit RPC12/RpoP